MKIHVLLSPHSADELYFTGKTVVVIDVLRATTVINTALSNGAKEVIPVNTIEFAMKVSGTNTLLCGERNTKMIEGFNLGNSPLDYTEEVVSGKSIILFTTNGSKSVVKAKFAEKVFIASFNNLEALSKRLVDLGNDIVILCSGAEGLFCIEDTVCAGKLIRKIEKIKPEIEFTDAARASIELNKSFGKDITSMLRDCEHGRKLIENDFEKDIDACAELSTLEICPEFSEGVIKLTSEDIEKVKSSEETEK